MHPCRNLCHGIVEGVAWVRCGGQEVRFGIIEHFCRIAVFHDLKMRDDPSLQREPTQDRLAERMDGHDLHAPGRIEYEGKQTSGLHQLFIGLRNAKQILEFRV